jgi:diaminopimelate epimerase
MAFRLIKTQGNSAMQTIPFYKMSGSGNDFIIIDNRQAVVPADDLARFAAQVCRRKMSVGADGLILVEDSDAADFKWRFFNSDGSVAEMCGNGARCVARFAFMNGIAPASMRFETLAGIIGAQVSADQVKVRMTDPKNLILEAELLTADHGTVAYGSVNTGVPHLVIEVKDIERVDVVALGRAIRHHPQFAPAGTNVNFTAPLTDALWAVRTYERGVEDETLACGTGVTAAALVLARKKAAASPVRLKARSGSLLKVHFTPHGNGFKDVFLEGDARIIYAGRLNSEAWNY